MLDLQGSSLTSLLRHHLHDSASETGVAWSGRAFRERHRASKDSQLPTKLEAELLAGFLALFRRAG
jgi:hypothetical protein